MIISKVIKLINNQIEDSINAVTKLDKRYGYPQNMQSRLSLLFQHSLKTSFTDKASIFKKVIKEIMKYAPWNYEKLPGIFKNDTAIVLTTVKNCSLIFEQLPDTLKNNTEIKAAYLSVTDVQTSTVFSPLKDKKAQLRAALGYDVKTKAEHQISPKN